MRVYKSINPTCYNGRIQAESRFFLSIRGAVNDAGGFVLASAPLRAGSAPYSTHASLGLHSVFYSQRNDVSASAKNSVRPTEGPHRSMSAPLRAIRGRLRAKEGAPRSAKGNHWPTMRLLRPTEDPLGPEKRPFHTKIGSSQVDRGRLRAAPLDQ